jgi:hypothetical protein
VLSTPIAESVLALTGRALRCRLQQVVIRFVRRYIGEEDSQREPRGISRGTTITLLIPHVLRSRGSGHSIGVGGEAQVEPRR